MSNNEQVKQLATNLRILSAEAVEAANSGHPGMPMGTADIMAVLWSEFLNFNPDDLNWAGRDRFVLSAGHGSAILYSLLHCFGFEVTAEDLRNFRQFGSITPGHPEYHVTPGVEVTTGPLGAGFANGVGMAASAKMMAARMDSDLFEHNIYGVVSDGDLMEGVAAEAASLAGHLALDNLIFFYDDNEISIGGDTDITFTEDVPARFRAYNWHIIEIDGHNYDEIRAALLEAQQVEDQPTLIVSQTKIGFGSPNRVGTAGVHGSPLGSEELALVKLELGWEADAEFIVKDQVQEFCRDSIADKQETYQLWQKEFTSWQEDNSAGTELLSRLENHTVSEELREQLFAELSAIKKDATRNISGKAIQIIAKHLPGFVGGSADLEPSTKTLIADSHDITPEDFSGRNFRFGVREHAMGSFVNGLAYSRYWIPYSATFLVFSDYMRPAIRLAALSKIQSIFIFTHDSFCVGEDGPTHQPIEHLSALRVIPNLNLYRPADGAETAACYLLALADRERPAAFALTRQSLGALQYPDNFDRTSFERGGYLLSDCSGTPETVLIASGSEVELAVAVAAELSDARVVSVPCLDLLLEQDEDYLQDLIPDGSKKVVIEAGSAWGWHQLVGNKALMVTKDDYGASAPYDKLMQEFGFTKDAILKKIALKFA